MVVQAFGAGDPAALRALVILFSDCGLQCNAGRFDLYKPGRDAGSDRRRGAQRCAGTGAGAARERPS